MSLYSPKSYQSVPSVNVGPTVVVRDPDSGIVGPPLSWGGSAYVVKNPPLPKTGSFWTIGSSSIANSFQTVSGNIIPSYRCIPGEGVWYSGLGLSVSGVGYAGKNNSVIVPGIKDVLARRPDVLGLALSYNDLAGNTEADAEIAFATEQAQIIRAMSLGISVIAYSPHFNGANWRAALHYGNLMQAWCESVGVPVIVGADCICARTDKIGTARSGFMYDSLHVNDLGARSGYGYEFKRRLVDNIPRRILSGGSAQVLSELFKNSRMVGSVAVSATGFSGTGPEDWGYARTGVPDTLVSMGSDDDGPYVQLVTTSTAANESITMRDTTFATALANRAGLNPAFTFRAFADIEVVTPGAIKAAVIYMPFSSGSMKFPNGNSADFTGTLLAGRRHPLSPPLSVATVGTSMADAPGIRMSFGGAGTTTVRLRGVSGSETRW